MTVLLGVDGGGTKTIAAVASLDGTVLSTARSAGSNYQSATEEGAERAIAEAVSHALSRAGASPDDVAASALGVAGFDGPAEAAIVRRVVARALKAAPSFVDNDSLLILRAGTDDGVGVGVVAGTGNNCIGRARDGRRIQIGGMGAISGDAGSAPDLAVRTARAAWRSSDGRAPPSALLGAILQAFSIREVERLADRVDDERFDDDDAKTLLGALFDVAGRGDLGALGVIDDVAEVLALNAHAALTALGLAAADRVVVLGGAVLEQYALLSARVALHIPSADVRVVPVAPVAGAILWAHDATGPSEAARKAFRSRLFDTLRV